MSRSYSNYRGRSNVSVPRKYQSSSSSSSSYRSKSLIVDKSTTKGGKKDIVKNLDMDILQDIISNLRDHAHYKTNKLPKDVKHNFDQLIQAVELLYNTNSYHVITDAVAKKFSNLENISPGSIGAYCAGCSIETTFDGNEKSCSSVCAGSMPIKGSSDNLCKYNVLLASRNRNGYSFNLLRSSDIDNNNDKKRGYVFIPHTNLEEFPGFTKAEKRKISRYGIDTVYLYGHDESGKEHFKLDETDVYELKSRKRKHKEQKSDVNINMSITWIIIFILFLLIAGFLLSNYWRRGRI